MYSGALIGQRIQSSGFSSVPSRSTTTAPAPAPSTTTTSTTTTTTTSAAVAVAAAATTTDSKPNLIQQQWSTILPGVNGKVTVKCLWNACRAISIGTTLIAIGAAMATVGYYANELSLEEQTTGNLTVKVKNTTRDFHLSNLSYVGPIIMGFGGFILVAACVMTFEARDNASKIVPARYLNKLRDTTVGVTNGGQINTSLFNTNGVHLQWDVNRLSPKPNLFQIQQQQQQTQQFAGSWESSTGSRGDLALTIIPDRSTLTADLVHFSKTLQKCIDLKQCSSRSRSPLKQPSQVQRVTSFNNALNLNRSPSAPDLLPEISSTVNHIYAPQSYYCSPISYCRWPPRPHIDNIKRGNLSLLPRQAISVDNPPHLDRGSCCPPPPVVVRNSMMATPTGNANAVPKSESDASMTMDLHFPDGSITLMVKDESKQSKQGDGGNAANNANSPNNAQERKDTTKRPPLLRQCRVEHADSELEFNNPG